MENIINSTNPIFSEPHLWVSKDIHPETARALISLFKSMDKERKSNKALEEAREQREAQKKESPPSKKRITASEVMSEQQMFQEELLKVVERLGMVEARQRKIIRVLHDLNQRFQEHTSIDSLGVTPVGSTTSSLGTGSQPCLDDVCLACNKVVRDCKCFD